MHPQGVKRAGLPTRRRRDSVLGRPVPVEEGGDQAYVGVGQLAGAVFGAGLGEPGADLDGVAVDADRLAGGGARPSLCRKSSRSWAVWAKADPALFQIPGDDSGAAGFMETWTSVLRKQTTRARERVAS